MLNILTLFLSYLIGSIPFALIIGKLFYKVDIREHGSGNLGATNTFRILGKKAGIVVLVADMLKGTLACLLPLLFNSNVNPIFCGLLAILGHVYPIFAGFRGGKAVATSTGVFLFLSPFSILTGFIVFVLTLAFSKYVSLSSIFASISVFIYSLLFEDKLIVALSFFISIFIIFKHRGNIRKIINGNENKIGKK